MNPLDLLKNLSQEDINGFGPNAWKQRRRIIFWTLVTCGGAFIGLTVTTIILLLASVFSGPIATDDNAVNLATAIIWASVSTATTVILGYVFGANLDAKDYRKSLITLPPNVNVPTPTPVVAAEPPAPNYQENGEPKG